MTRRQARDRGVGLVVGGSCSIGAAIGEMLGGLGLEVHLWGRDHERLDAASRQVTGAGGQVSVAAVDVTDREALAAAVADLPAGRRLEVVVYAAGVFDWATADQADVEVTDRLLDVNLSSAAAATRLLLPRLLDSEPSALVYIGSGASRQAFAHNAAYVASKHGLLGLSQAVWADVRDRGVKVSIVSPGLVLAGAGMWAPAARESPHDLLSPSDVADAVRFVVQFPHRGCPTEIRIETQRAV